MSYMNVYKLRLDRYGLNYQERIQNKREHQFDLYLLKSVYRIDFEYDGSLYPGSFEKYKQDETETLHYLLTNTDLIMPCGTILQLPNFQGQLKPWMVYYLETIEASGYNRYIMLKMSHYVTWIDREKTQQSSYVYLYGQENNMLKDELKSRSRADTVYDENLKSSFFIMPTNSNIKKDDYLIIGEKPLQEYFRVTGYDIWSSEGVEYVTIDPVYEYDLTPAPTRTESDNAADFFWLEGGII